MSWSDAVSTPENLFRTTSTGLRVFAPAVAFGRLALVSDDGARRIQADVRRGWWWLIALVVLSSRVLQGWGWWAIAGVGLASGLAFRYWLARGLPKVPRASVTLVPVNRRARQLALARATGADELWLHLSLAALGVLVGVVVAVRFDNVDGWWLAGLLTAVAWAFARQIRALRSERHTS